METSLNINSQSHFHSVYKHPAELTITALVGGLLVTLGIVLRIVPGIGTIPMAILLGTGAGSLLLALYLSTCLKKIDPEPQKLSQKSPSPHLQDQSQAKISHMHFYSDLLPKLSGYKEIHALAIKHCLKHYPETPLPSLEFYAADDAYHSIFVSEAIEKNKIAENPQAILKAAFALDERRCFKAPQNAKAALAWALKTQHKDEAILALSQLSKSEAPFVVECLKENPSLELPFETFASHDSYYDFFVAKVVNPHKFLEPFNGQTSLHLTLCSDFVTGKFHAPKNAKAALEKAFIAKMNVHVADFWGYTPFMLICDNMNKYGLDGISNELLRLIVKMMKPSEIKEDLQKLQNFDLSFDIDFFNQLINKVLNG